MSNNITVEMPVMKFGDKPNANGRIYSIEAMDTMTANLLHDMSGVIANRFTGFTNDEIYMLSRALVESSEKIVMSGRYNKGEILTYTKLLNEVDKERLKRGL